MNRICRVSIKFVFNIDMTSWEIIRYHNKLNKLPEKYFIIRRRVLFVTVLIAFVFLIILMLFPYLRFIAKHLFYYFQI